MHIELAESSARVHATIAAEGFVNLRGGNGGRIAAAVLLADPLHHVALAGWLQVSDDESGAPDVLRSGGKKERCEVLGVDARSVPASVPRHAMDPRHDA